MKFAEQKIKPESSFKKALTLALLIPLLDSCSIASTRNTPVSSFEIGSEVSNTERTTRSERSRQTSNDCLLVASERVYMGDSLTADWAVLVLENIAGSSSNFRVSNLITHNSTFVSIPQWGSQTVRIGSRSLKIVVAEMSADTPAWADIEAYTNCN